MARTSACSDAPDGEAVVLPAHRVGNAIRAICVGFSAGGLKIIEACGPHRSIINLAKIDPHLAVFMHAHSRQAEVARVNLPPPETLIERRADPPTDVLCPRAA